MCRDKKRTTDRSYLQREIMREREEKEEEERFRFVRFNSIHHSYHILWAFTLSFEWGLTILDLIGSRDKSVFLITVT